MQDSEISYWARRVLGLAQEEKITLAVAESLTGGALCSALVDVPGASACLKGGVCVYEANTKATILGVDAQLLSCVGPVNGQVAAQMATGVRRLFSSDFGMSTTGVAGPQPQDGHAPGQVFISVSLGDKSVVDELQLCGDRSQVRAQSIVALLRLAARTLSEAFPAGGVIAHRM